MDIKLRYGVQPGDPELVYKITTDTDFFRPEELEIAKELAEETLEDPSCYSFIFVLVDDEEAGYLCYSEIPGTVGSYEIYWAAVYKKFQGAGLGKYLFKEAENKIKEVNGRQIFLSTSGTEQYAPTRKFYDKLGYEKAATLKDFFLPGDDEVIYRKVIADTQPEMPNN